MKILKLNVMWSQAASLVLGVRECSRGWRDGQEVGELKSENIINIFKPRNSYELDFQFPLKILLVVQSLSHV